MPVKRYAVVIAGLVAGCHSSPTVTANNASAAEVADKVKAVAASGDFVSPGHWEGTATIEKMDMPGVPAAMAERMRAQMAKGHSFASCLTEEEAKKPKADFFGSGPECRYDHFTMGGGVIDAAMTCTEQGVPRTMTMKGTYSADAYAMRVASSTPETAGHPMSGMSMAVTVHAKRTGACTGKEDNLDGGQ